MILHIQSSRAPGSSHNIMLSCCAVCGVAAELKCGGCKVIVYCGRDHQRLHWKREHKSNCGKCYKLATNDLLGRHIVAARQIKRNEVILVEQPIVFGPKLVSEPMCLGCNVKLAVPLGQDKFYECSNCKWPLCGKGCEKNPAHLAECRAIGQADQACPIVGSQISSGYCAIVTLRCLLMQQNDPKSYEGLASLEDHLEMRINTPIYQVLKVNLVTYIRNVLGLKQFDDQQILKTAAMLDTNCFEVRPHQKNTKLRAVYPKAAMISHDCVPNTRHVFDENLQLSVLATVDIPEGAIINVTYTQSLKSTIERRAHLRFSKCFDCCCSRCADPSELDTFCGAIVCSKCKTGKQVSTDPLDERATWNCTNCEHKIAGKQVEMGNKSLQTEFDRLEKRSPKAFEEFLRRYEDTLHATNTHVLQVKYALIQLYGNVDGFRLHELTDAGLHRKIELCNELLAVAEILDPGASLFRGKILLDLQQALAVQTKRQFNEGLITKETTKEQLFESMEMLQEAVDILKIDPSMTNELADRVNCLASEMN